MLSHKNEHLPNNKRVWCKRNVLFFLRWPSKSVKIKSWIYYLIEWNGIRSSKIKPSKGYSIFRNGYNEHGYISWHKITELVFSVLFTQLIKCTEICVCVCHVTDVFRFYFYFMVLSCWETQLYTMKFVRGESPINSNWCVNLIGLIAISFMFISLVISLQFFMAVASIWVCECVVFLCVLQLIRIKMAIHTNRNRTEIQVYQIRLLKFKVLYAQVFLQIHSIICVYILTTSFFFLFYNFRVTFWGYDQVLFVYI